jgi:GT2 family glycosyltransferase
MIPELSVVIPTHERPDELSKTLERLDRQRDAPPFEVIVVANSGDDMAPVEQAIGRRQVQPRLTAPNIPGVSAARNLGVQVANSGLILFLGDDILPSSRLLREHLAWHEEHPEDEVGVLGHVRWAKELRVTPFMRWLEQGMQFDYGTIRGREAGAGRFYTANVSLKRRLFELAGGFDETMPFLFEDIELAHRLAERGFRLLYNRRAWAEHLHETTVDAWKGRMAIAGAAEHNFVQTHADAEPRLYEQMTEVMAVAPAHGRAAKLVGIIPRWVPIIGPIVWRSAEQQWMEQLAPPFLKAWEEASDRRAAEAVSR